MKRIYEQTYIVNRILPKQKIDTSKKYRKFYYITECPVQGGILLSNTVTYELLFLSDDEKKLLNNPNLNDKTVQYLAEQYFLVPENFDDKKFASGIIDTRIQMQNIYTNPSFSFFVILTTTGCNARCFYCFEQGAKVSNMTEQTAHDVAAFIKRKGDKKVKIQWFGGEPLVNTNAIDTICNDLIENKVNFASTMVSNAYLLDEETIKKAVELWKLEKIQITLDGTEEVYNKVKNYVYKDVSSPFKKVLNNVENALKAGIKISIRLNMGEHNIEDLYELSKMLVKKFNKYNNCHIYVVRLFEQGSYVITNKTHNQHKLIESAVELQNYIDNNMPVPALDRLQKSVMTPNTCMACNDKAVMIVPDGHLGKCEHFVDSDFFGSIYSDDYDLKKIAKYKERRIVSPNCEDCEFKSLCMPLKCCTGIPDGCDEIEKKALTARLHSKLKNIYNKFLEEEAEKGQ